MGGPPQPQKIIENGRHSGHHLRQLSGRVDVPKRRLPCIVAGCKGPRVLFDKLSPGHWGCPKELL